jgi:hypothetical protein
LLIVPSHAMQTIREWESTHNKKNGRVNDPPKKGKQVQRIFFLSFILQIPIIKVGESNRIKQIQFQWEKKTIFFHQSKIREKKTFKWPWSDIWKKEFRQVPRLSFPLYLYGIVPILRETRKKRERSVAHSSSHAIQHVMHRWTVKHPVNMSRMSATDKKKDDIRMAERGNFPCSSACLTRNSHRLHFSGLV